MRLKGFHLAPESKLKKEIDGFYQTKYWKAIRIAHLMDNPLCVVCERDGKVREATVVDHIVPRRAGGSDFHDNLQSLCYECHQRKSGSEGRETMYDNNPKWRK